MLLPSRLAPGLQRSASKESTRTERTEPSERSDDAAAAAAAVAVAAEKQAPMRIQGHMPGGLLAGEN